MITEKEYLPLYSAPPKSLIGGLNRVYQLIEKGWCQYALALDRFGEARAVYDLDVKEVCLSGAILRACFGSTEMRQEMLRLISETSNSVYISVVSFNDRPETTKEDILKLITEAKLKLEYGACNSQTPLV